MDKLVILLGILIICCIVFVINKVRDYGSIYGPGYEPFSNVMSQAVEASVDATSAAANKTEIVDMKGEKKEEEKVPIEPFALASDKHELSLKATIQNKALDTLTRNIKEAFLSKRLEPFVDKETDDTTNCTVQGKEYKSKDTRSGCNDPAYIRKDSIPCYACNLK